MGNVVEIREQKPYSQQPAINPPHKNMVWIPGGTFLMGSDQHYPEEALVGGGGLSLLWLFQQ